MTFHESPTDIPDPEVLPQAKHRKFSAEFEAQWRREQALALELNQKSLKKCPISGGQFVFSELGRLNVQASSWRLGMFIVHSLGR
jgi:hypothetical protein